MKSSDFRDKLEFMNSLSVNVELPPGNYSFPMEVKVDVTASHGKGMVNPTRSADIIYQLELANAARGTGLRCTNTSVSLIKAVDEGAVAMSETVRKQTAMLMQTDYKYDLRGLFYAAGELTGMLLCGVPWPVRRATPRSVIPYATLSDENALALIPTVRYPRIVAYMMCLTGRMCGVTHLEIGAEQYQLAEAPDDDVTKRRYIHFLMQALQPDVFNMNVYGEHMFAYYRGVSRYLTLRSHSSEGGWVRDAMASATYPKPRGIVSTPVTETVSFPRFGTRNTSEKVFVCDVVSHVLECAACVQDADPAAELNLTTVLANKESDDESTWSASYDAVAASRPSAFADINQVLDRIEAHTCVMLNRTDVGHACDNHANLLPRNTFRDYLSNDAVDKHFLHQGFMPYSFVENGGLLKHPSAVKQKGPKAGSVVELPLFGSDVRVPKRYVETVSASGYHSAPRVYYGHQNVGLRAIGAYYLGSGAFGGNELSNMRLVAPTDGELNPIMCRDDLSSLAAAHWVRPHCPVPMAGECAVLEDKAMIEVRTVRGSYIRTGVNELVLISVGEPVATSVTSLSQGAKAIRCKINNRYRKVLNMDEMSDDEEIKDELFSDFKVSLLERHVGDTGGLLGSEGAPVILNGDTRSDMKPHRIESDKSDVAAKTPGPGAKDDADAGSSEK